jgi:Mrp family chromosome partitioning ATPase
MGKRKRERQNRKNQENLKVWSSTGGDTGDGGIAVISQNGQLIHVTHAELATGIRQMVARLQTSEKGSIPAVLAVTSALQGEGVTTVARSLASVMANDLSSSTCIVDLNWWTPTASDGSVPGLADVIAGTTRLSDVITTTINPHLSLVNAGNATVSQRPILANSVGLQSAIDELRSKFDRLVLDLPPVLNISESLVLTGLADGFILVVQPGITTEVQVRAVLSDLSHVPALGVVMNRMTSNVPAALARVFAP